MIDSLLQRNCSRRNFLGLLTSAGFSARALAQSHCQPTPYGQLCVSQVNFAEFVQEAFQTQHATEWCWAACISMLFAFYNHPVSQERIVSEVYGGIVNMPAGYGGTIAKQLNRNWKDDNGSRFSSRLTGAYDADANVRTLNNMMLISELNGNHPVVIGSGGHAMVLTMMQTLQNQMGLNPQRCGVFDPWPGRGARDLTPLEMLSADRGGLLRFAATARVTDITD
jgi:hypothetical protein